MSDWGTLGFVRVAVVAPPVHLGDPAANAVEIAHWSTRLASDGAALICFPELSLTGYTCEDLFLTDGLREQTEAALASLAATTAGLDATIVVGLPLSLPDGRRINGAAVLDAGRVVGVVPKQHLPNAGEFYERRWFTPGFGIDTTVALRGLDPFPVHANLLFRRGPILLGVEICEDLWAPDPPSTALAIGGANVVVNPSASNELVAKADYRRELVRQQSARTHTVYAYAGSGPTESTKDLVFGGHTMIAENGAMSSEGERFVLEGASTTADIDITRLLNERARDITWSTAPRHDRMRIVEIERPLPPLRELRRTFPRNPFVPDDLATRDARAEEILAIQSTGLARRVLAAGADRLVIGVSGGLDSTLALLVCAETMRRLGRPNTSIIGVTMPGLGTTERTRTAADDLMENLGVTARVVPIGDAVAQHFRDIAHDPADYSVVFENAQARERTQILFDIANQVGGIVVGTGDLSELALGWCTFNADHMSNYGVNSSVPKTLVRHLVRWFADHRAGSSERLDVILHAVADTPVSPELLPPDANGNIAQATEEVIGPYELHDFFLFHLLRNGESRDKISALSKVVFADTHTEAELDQWLEMFWRRFHTQQFKRTTLPPGPKVGSVSVSPRGDLRLPDELRG